jgi:hypothetical protein
MKLSMQTLPTISWVEITGLLSVGLPTIIYLVTRWLDKKKFEKELETKEAENKKLLADAEVVKASARKVESEVAQGFISSSGALVEEYKEMLKNLNDKYTALETRQEITEEKLELEIVKRRENERLLREMYHGLRILLNQFSESKTEPRWVPDARLIAKLDKLEEYNK